MSNAADGLHNVLCCINKEHIINILHNAGQSIQPHASINIRVLHGRIMAMAVTVKLGKDNVPEFNVAVAVAADTTGRFAAAVFRAAVKVNLGARAAGTGTVFPEVVLFSKADNMVRRYADFFGPNIKRLVIVQINGNPQPVLRHLHYFRAELPCPRNGLMLKVITEGEIAEHFKERAVAVGNADVFNIAGTNALLAGRYTAAGRCHLAGKVFFHRCHAAINQQQGVIIFWNQ